MTLNDYWTLDKIETLMRMMKSHDCTEVTIGDIAITRTPPIDLSALANQKSTEEKMTDDDWLLDPMKGLGGGEQRVANEQ